jgi:hypothetical protein
MGFGCLLLITLVAVPLPGQVVRALDLYSELVKIDPFGQVDTSHKPREILSPGVARGGFFSLQVAVTAEPKTIYMMAVQSNPANVFQWKLYKEKYSPEGKKWVPDKFEEMQEPYFRVMPDIDVQIPGQTTQVYLLDVWVPREAPVGRIRLEVLAKSDTWRVAPMEVRVLDAVFPEGVNGAAAGSLSAVVERNQQQDAMLARTLPNEGKGCYDAQPSFEEQGRERYLRVRDCLYWEASRQ